ncbi:helix-turn-helix domain-containing protein [Marinobacter zhanjiangensis]|uniref:Helix-turn-helix n=1 Tax=Marinobacter zhanjiangensis TaxID=578215 RepID=A0ABQ3B331_9GAMM|nr:helix-turn-helix transcriptional regulator [Marinobacter zhanjiangensis]GGY74224.1 hypothetical protein GCM10007071_22040 [Marinobacter zhanjiangensis]
MMFSRPFPQTIHPQAREPAVDDSHTLSELLPRQTDFTPQDEADIRLTQLEANEPKRQLIRDARVLCKQRKITQAQMANEIGIPRRTLEEWLQFRRIPKSPGETLIRRWVEAYSEELPSSA